MLPRHDIRSRPIAWLRRRLAALRRRRAIAALLPLDDHILDDLGHSRAALRGQIREVRDVRET